jgi:hypothetical protein
LPLGEEFERRGQTDWRWWAFDFGGTINLNLNGQTSMLFGELSIPENDKDASREVFFLWLNNVNLLRH